MNKDYILFLGFMLVLLATSVPLGKCLAKVYQLKPVVGDKIFTPLENALYKIMGVNQWEGMNWKQYSWHLIAFNVLGFLLLFVMQLVQAWLPLNLEHLGNVESWHLAFNTASSFMTNTNWQSYSGETTLSYFTQMAGLTVQNFVSAATGVAVAIALIRGLINRGIDNLGNFYVDLTRSVTRVFLPMCVVFALVLVACGVPQNLNAYPHVTTLEGVEQIIATGPVASQEAIKLLGTNGGGFFNANSAHPYENPTPFTNFLEMYSILIVSAALLTCYGEMCGSKKQGYAILASMSILFTLMFGICYWAESSGNNILAAYNLSGATAMEGKEVRFGIGSSTLFTTVTTAASCGAVNSWHDCLTGIGGLVPMLQMMLGEIVYGGTGAGFYGMLLYVFITVFIIGLMVGRTPEYLGKKVESREIVFTIVGLLIPSITVLGFSAAASVLDVGLSGISQPGPHGLSEVLYAYASGAGNNGSAFGGLGANCPWYNVTIGLAMLIGRFGVIVPVLAIAGSMSTKKITPASAGTFDTGSVLFALLLCGIILLVGALTFFPALALGPVVDHLFMLQGKVF